MSASDLCDRRGNGLQFFDLTIVNEDLQTTISSNRGTITIFESFGQKVSSTRTTSSSSTVLGAAPGRTCVADRKSRANRYTRGRHLEWLRRTRR
jgi:hypothetical protein